MEAAKKFKSGLLGAVGVKVTTDAGGITEGIGPFRRTIPWAEVRDVRVARPGGLLPGVTAIVTRPDGTETPLMSLVLDVLPSSSEAHDRLRAIAAELEASRP
jgi:hypothetical protein